MFDLNRLQRLLSPTVEELRDEVYAVLNDAGVKGIDGPLKINTTGNTPSIVFNPGTLTQGSPFQVMNAGNVFNYTFGPLTSGGPNSSYTFGDSTNYFNPTYGGNVYNFTGDDNDDGGNVFVFNPADFPPQSPPPGNNWSGGGGGGGGGGGSVWVEFNEAGGGDTGAGAGGTQTAIAQVVSGAGSEYQMKVYGPGGNTFVTAATAKGLAAEDKLDKGSWHTLTAYVSADGSAEVYFTPAVFHTGGSS